MKYSLSSKACIVYIATFLERITEEEWNSIFSELNKQSF